MATVLKTDSSRHVLVGTGKDGAVDYKQLREAVGGNIEAVTLVDGTVMFLNEEGKLLPGFEANPHATLLLREAGGIPGDVVMGNVVLCKPGEDGEVF